MVVRGGLGAGSEGRAGSMVVRGWGWEHGSEGVGLGAW